MFNELRVVGMSDTYLPAAKLPQEPIKKSNTTESVSVVPANSNNKDDLTGLIVESNPENNDNNDKKEDLKVSDDITSSTNVNNNLYYNVQSMRVNGSDENVEDVSDVMFETSNANINKRILEMDAPAGFHG